MITKNHRIFLSKADKTLKKIIEDNKIPKISKYTVQRRVNLSFIFKKLTKQVPVNLITGTLIINNIHLIFEGT